MTVQVEVVLELTGECTPDRVTLRPLGTIRGLGCKGRGED